jgi:hypothetical protein
MPGLRIPSLGIGVLGRVGGCSNDLGDDIKAGGGGFIFNYRIAEATAGVIAEPQRDIPDGAKIEASFENPAGGERIVVAKLVTQGRKRYSFDTPPLSGLKPDKRLTIGPGYARNPETLAPDAQTNQ